MALTDFRVLKLYNNSTFHASLDNFHGFLTNALKLRTLLSANALALFAQASVTETKKFENVDKSSQRVLALILEEIAIDHVNKGPML